MRLKQKVSLMSEEGFQRETGLKAEWLGGAEDSAVAQVHRQLWKQRSCEASRDGDIGPGQEVHMEEKACFGCL